MSVLNPTKTKIDTPYSPTQEREVSSVEISSGSTENSETTTSHTSENSLQEIHRRSISTPYPDNHHSHREKDHNNSRQKITLDIDDINRKIKREKRSLRKANREGDEKASKKSSESIKQLEQKRSALEKSIKKPTTSKSSAQGRHSEKSSHIHDEDSAIHQRFNELRREIESKKKAFESALDTGHEKEAEKIKEELEVLIRKHSELVADLDSSVESPSQTDESSTSSENIHELATSQDEVAINGVEQILDDRRIALQKAQTDLITRTRANANKAEIEQRQNQVSELQSEVAKLAKVLSIANQSPDAALSEQGDTGGSPPQSPHSKDQHSLAGVIHRTRTGKRRTAIPDQSRATSTPSTPFKELHESANRNSALLSRDDLKQYLSDQAKSKLEKLDNKIDAVASTIDLQLAERAKLIKQHKGSNSPSSDPHVKKNIQKIDLEIRNLVIKLGKLMVQLAAIEDLMLPRTEQLSLEEKKHRYEAFLATHKSDKTRRLEKIYQDKVAAYQKKVLSSLGTDYMSLLAGAVTNFSTFFWGNSLTRLLASSVPTAAAYIGGGLAGFLHIVVGGSVLKQAAAASWTAPGLVEFNNYWKLLGASWGDYWRGEKEKEKYASKNPKNSRLLTIEQRLAEERPFGAQFWDRYKTEEAAYYSYSFNFICKAIFAGGFSDLMKTQTDASKVIEWVAHSVMGWFSGAETVAGIQLARSKVPGAKEEAIPNQEIHAAHAAMLTSLLDDLEKAYKNRRSENTAEASLGVERDLLKAIRRTKKALAQAETKSYFGGTFWYEFIAQFKTADARADVASEVLGRALSVMPAAALSNLLAAWRTSGNPWLTFAGHAIPAFFLIAPPGWTLRPLYTGFFRALIQAAINGRSPDVRTAQPEPHDSIIESADSSSFRDSDFETSDDRSADESVVIDSVDEVSHEIDSDDEWVGNPTAHGTTAQW
jgi:hypothetical protein